MSNGACDEAILACIEFYKAVSLFVEMDYDIKGSIKANAEDFLKDMGVDNLQFFNMEIDGAITEYLQLQ